MAYSQRTAPRGAEPNYEKYMEILNKTKDADCSPLRAKKTGKTQSVGSAMPNANWRDYPRRERESTDVDSQSYDFSRVQLPFNFATAQHDSQQDLNAIDEEENNSTISQQQEEVQLVPVQGPNQRSTNQGSALSRIANTTAITSMQQQLDTCLSTMQMLTDRHELLERRVTKTQDSVKDLDAKTQHAVDASRVSVQGNSARGHQQRMSMDMNENKKIEENIAEIDKHLSSVQVQVDRLDSKIQGQKREVQQAQDGNIRHLQKQIDQLSSQNFVNKDYMQQAVDSLGEEIASDINEFEQHLKAEVQKIDQLIQSTTGLQADFKVFQIGLSKTQDQVNMALQSAQGEGSEKFSETLVKQLLRQGEDRKASVEDTAILQSKITEVKHASKKHRDQIVRIVRSLAHLEGGMRKTNNYVEMIKTDRARTHKSRSISVQKQRDSVNQQCITNLKERVNYGFRVLLKLQEECYHRDKVITESLLDTQMGRNRNLICGRDCHDSLISFFELLSEPFQEPDILLGIKENDNFKPRNSSKKHRSASSKKHSRKRSTSSKMRKTPKRRQIIHEQNLYDNMMSGSEPEVRSPPEVRGRSQKARSGSRRSARGRSGSGFDSRQRSHNMSSEPSSKLSRRHSRKHRRSSQATSLNQANSNNMDLPSEGGDVPNHRHISNVDFAEQEMEDSSLAPANSENLPPNGLKQQPKHKRTINHRKGQRGYQGAPLKAKKGPDKEGSITYESTIGSRKSSKKKQLHRKKNSKNNYILRNEIQILSDDTDEQYT